MSNKNLDAPGSRYTGEDENKENNRREILEEKAREYIKSQREKGVTLEKSDDELVKALVDFSEELSKESRERGDTDLGAKSAVRV